MKNHISTNSIVTMEDKENQVKGTGRQIKQQITIPFIWEERPGTPKKDWKPKHEPLFLAARPVKYVASVPFKWEEKPGTPLQCFASESKEPQIPETASENKSLPLPPVFFAKIEYDDSDDSSSYGDYYEDPDWISEWGSEALSIQTEESFSTAVPLQNPFVNSLKEIPGSPESGSSPTKYAAGSAASLRGAAFLEHLFPLFPPKSGFLDKPDHSEEKAQVPEREPPVLAEHKKLGGDCSRSGAIRRPLTLQELIMLSRRRSCRREAVHVKKQNPPKVTSWFMLSCFFIARKLLFMYV
uniref:Uncharacterized protein n=1 Tax=Opuntia streptacantha TaxID=393608 RepID=A0A7C8YQ65_OPUST